MKAKLQSYYRKSSTIMVFVYVVVGTIAELAKYKEVQGDNYRENEKGEPLFFSMRPLSNNRNESIPLLITSTGRVVADDLDKVLRMQEVEEIELTKAKAKLLARRAVYGDNALQQLAAATSTRPVETHMDIPDAVIVQDAPVVEPVAPQPSGAPISI